MQSDWNIKKSNWLHKGDSKKGQINETHNIRLQNLKYHQAQIIYKT